MDTAFGDRIRVREQHSVSVHLKRAIVFYKHLGIYHANVNNNDKMHADFGACGSSERCNDDGRKQTCRSW